MPKNFIRRWLRRHRLYTGPITHVRFYAEQSDLPEVPRANELAVAGTPERPKWALIDCPCGRGHTVLMPLSKTTKPHWRVIAGGRTGPSIDPSIDRNRDSGVRCHYWIRDGAVIWV